MQRFSDYISSRGVSYEDGYSFSFVTDMSSDGLWFTGWGLTANFELTSFVVYVPTPASGSVLALGMIAMRRRRR